MPHELVNNLNLSLNIGLISILCYAIIKGYISESVDYEKKAHYLDNHIQIDTDVSEVMDLVRFFTVFLFIASFLTYYLFGANSKSPIDPIVMKMFIWGAVFYLGHDLVWILIGLLWFAGSAIHALLIGFHKPHHVH